MNEHEQQTLTANTHLTPAEVGRLLGQSPARVREMIRHGELTQEQVAGRWLIPVAQIERILNPSSALKEHKAQAGPSSAPRPKSDQRQRPGQLAAKAKPSPPTTSQAPLQNIPDLALQIEHVEARMQQIDAELRDLRSGLLNDERRAQIAKLKTEKRKQGKKLHHLQRELFRRENRGKPRF